MTEALKNSMVNDEQREYLQIMDEYENIQLSFYLVRSHLASPLWRNNKRNNILCRYAVKMVCHLTVVGYNFTAALSDITLYTEADK